MVAFRPQRSWSASDKVKVRRAALTESSFGEPVIRAGPFRGIAQQRSGALQGERRILGVQQGSALPTRPASDSSAPTELLCLLAVHTMYPTLHFTRGPRLLHQHSTPDDNSAGLPRLNSGRRRSPRHAGTMQHDDSADE